MAAHPSLWLRRARPTLQTFTHASDCCFATDIDVTVDGCAVEVLRTAAADFANIVFDPIGGPVGSRHVRIRNCFQRTNAMEIGHELSVDRVGDITFRDIDVLSVHGHGAVFSIHNYDRAIVDNVLFENIRVEHCYEKFIDIRISRSRFSSDEERGHIRNITFRDIHWTQSPSNAGYTTSLIGGWNEAHRVEDIHLENIFIDGQRVTHLDELEIHTRYADDITLG